MDSDQAVAQEDLSAKIYEMQKTVRDQMKRLTMRLYPYAGLLGIVLMGLLSCYYLFWRLTPWCDDAVTERLHYLPKQNVVLEPNSPVDVYVNRDVSGSANAASYDGIENDIVKVVSLNLASGDRASYIKFGAGTIPESIQPATDNVASLATNRAVKVPPQVAAKTDFALLFQHLQKAIQKERQADSSTLRTSRPDLVLILSDGVPDLEKHGRRCPVDFERAGLPFIDDNIKKSFESLVNHSYPERGKILPFLILAGGKSSCAPEIQAEWEAALGSLGLKVVTYPEFKARRDVWNGMMASIDKTVKSERTPCVFIRPLLTRLEDEQIANFLAKREFSARYSFWSYFTAGEIKIKKAFLLDKDNHELAQLYTVNEHGQFPDQGNSHPVITTDNPAEGHQRSALTSKNVWFKFDADNAFGLTLSDLEPSYKIHLEVDSNPICQQADDLLVGISSTRTVKGELLGRVKMIAAVVSAVALIYAAMIFIFSRVNMEVKGFLYRLGRGIYWVAIRPVKYWAGAFVVLLGVVALSWMSVIHPVSVFIAPILATAVVTLARKTLPLPKPWGEPFVVSLELMLLPILEWSVFFIADKL